MEPFTTLTEMFTLVIGFLMDPIGIAIVVTLLIIGGLITLFKESLPARRARMSNMVPPHAVWAHPDEMPQYQPTLRSGKKMWVYRGDPKRERVWLTDQEAARHKTDPVLTTARRAIHLALDAQFDEDSRLRAKPVSGWGSPASL